MKLISHRGNINGIHPIYENRPEYINSAINSGYDVEIDVWRINGDLYLGHDAPTYPINQNYLMNNRLLCHAKNSNSLSFMLKFREIHCFWHQEDTYTLTSRAIPVVYPNCEPIENSIVMVREIQTYFELLRNDRIYGICFDQFEDLV